MSAGSAWGGGQALGDERRVAREDLRGGGTAGGQYRLERGSRLRAAAC